MSGIEIPIGFTAVHPNPTVPSAHEDAPVYSSEPLTATQAPETPVTHTETAATPVEASSASPATSGATVLIGNVETAAETVLSIFNTVNNSTNSTTIHPAALAAIGMAVSTVGKAGSDVAVDVANPAGLVNVAMDAKQFADFQSAYSLLKSELSKLKVKI